MDRLIIESTLANTNEISIAERVHSYGLVLNFKANNAGQVSHAFDALRKIAEQHPLDLMICKTMMPGIYDLEIKTEGLDEPIRIMNKAISNEVFESIETRVSGKEQMALVTNIAEAGNPIYINAAHIRNCD